MEALNMQARKHAIYRCTLAGILTLLFIPVCIYTYLNIPQPSLPVTEHSTPVDQATLTAIKEKLQAAATKQAKINIMLLVDATPGMEPYLPAVAKAAEQLQAQHAYQISAACYRDAAEGPWLYATNEMKSKQAAYWLNDLYTDVYQDEDEPEAVYYGLKTALQSEALVPGETNILILAGDAGNHAQDAQTEVPPAEIVQLMKEKNCHFAAFQVRHPDTHSTYEDFGRQLKNEVIQPLVQQYKDQPAESMTTQGTTLLSEGNSRLALHTLNSNTTLPPDTLTKDIIAFAEKVIESTASRVKAMHNLRNGKSLPASDKHTLLLLETYGITSSDVHALSQAPEAGE